MLKIEVNDSTGRKIDSFNVNNNKQYGIILKLLKEKYGYSPEIETEETKKENEQDWLEQ